VGLLDLWVRRDHHGHHHGRLYHHGHRRDLHGHRRDRHGILLFLLS
jgi:hypothetical protein